MFNHDKYQKQVEAAVNKFKRSRKRIQESDHPIYNVEGAREYEIEQHREEMDAEVERINGEFEAAITQELERAKAEAARSRFYVSADTRADAEHMVDSFITDASFATNERDKIETFFAFEDKLNTLDEAGLSVVRLQLPKIAQALGDDKTLDKDLRMLHSTLSRLKTPEQERYEELQALKMRGVDIKHRMMKLAQRNAKR
ncbi:hypothetical protein M3557_07480 [Bhargavaea ginsengi]|uniref:hypothetical protein n=1 Tax=Bhargavaea ginsengi TaxID=426757 RepID=UPI0020407DD2|nr:hypothetical protein [Bhargavaea ginsengi]MCM3087754.1 hypothetical protein [Bhargavaea ginsengi]